MAALLSLITVIALTPLFKDLPEAVLAALIIHAVSHLMKVAEMRRYYRLVRREFWLGILTLAGLIILDVLPGLIIGVVLSILLVVYRDSRIPVSILGADPVVPGAYLDQQRHPTAQPTPGMLIVRPDGTLYYVNAQSVQDTIESLLSASPIRSTPSLSTSTPTTNWTSPAARNWPSWSATCTSNTFGSASPTSTPPPSTWPAAPAHSTNSTPPPSSKPWPKRWRGPPRRARQRPPEPRPPIPTDPSCRPGRYRDQTSSSALPWRTGGRQHRPESSRDWRARDRANRLGPAPG